MTKRKRVFEVWVGCNHEELDSTRLEFSNNETDEEIEVACQNACDTMIANNFDSGWGEVAEEDL